ncbi:DNA (cytosine-5)-methyltransferase 3C-like [Menidia menidia]
MEGKTARDQRKRKPLANSNKNADVTGTMSDEEDEEDDEMLEPSERKSGIKKSLGNACIQTRQKVKSTSVPHGREGSPLASPESGKFSRRPSDCRRRYPLRSSCNEENRIPAPVKQNPQSSVVDRVGIAAKATPHNPSKGFNSTDDTDYTDSSSEESVRADNRRLRSRKSLKARQRKLVSSSGSDDEDPTSQSESHEKAIGDMVWGNMEGFSRWPGIIVPYSRGSRLPGKGLVEWYGQRMSSQISLRTLEPFAAFEKHFCANSFATQNTYREAIFLSLQEAALRCKKQFSTPAKDREELLRQMLDWAVGGFLPSGPSGLKHTPSINRVTRASSRQQEEGNLFRSSHRVPDASSPLKQKSSSSTMSEDSVSSDELSSSSWEKSMALNKIKKSYVKLYNKANHSTSAYTQPDQKLREEIINRIVEMKLDIEGYCLCCGEEDVEISHPLFKGSLCLECKNNFTETLFRYDDDGYQSYCTICCYGMEVVLCGNDSCCRSYCEDCLNILVAPGTFDTLKLLDPWICYLCQPHTPCGALVPREDWSIRVQELFANNSAMAFEPHRVYPSIAPSLRRPLRVLSLFDGIATGYLVLKDLGFKVDKYVASEVCEASVSVGTINHDGRIFHVGDVRFITKERIEEWGPFDLLIGGSPCNDLTIVNPSRKGLYEGTGRLFFEYYRILQLLKPKEEDPRPFFWLFENVVSMTTHDKINICRFLECNPVLVDAIAVSPAHRARYFWGNIPGMSRPIIPSQKDKLRLQDCLEIGREATVTKVRTITSNLNSLKQGKGMSQLPVTENGRGDKLWITEIEKIFGFPKHYTDVRNMNRQQRQNALAKSWSVPVVRHLLAPLKDYFACAELPPATTPGTITSSTPTAAASPDTQPRD